MARGICPLAATDAACALAILRGRRSRGDDAFVPRMARLSDEGTALVRLIWAAHGVSARARSLVRRGRLPAITGRSATVASVSRSGGSRALDNARRRPEGDDRAVCLDGYGLAA